MGRPVFSKPAYEAVMARVSSDPSRTHRAEQSYRRTRSLNPLVDPKGFGVIRRSLPRFDEVDGKWLLTVGTPMPIEVRFDTTGSMGGNVEVALDVLPNLYDLLKDNVLSRYDIQIAMGVFNDIVDEVVLCRSQFEMDEKIAEQLTYMLPLRGGGDGPEDPHYGLFGAAYLTSAYIDKIGLKGYDFTISDATAHSRFDESQLVRVFGDEVFDKVAENGYQISRRDLPSIKEVVDEMKKRTHPFFLQVGNDGSTRSFWEKMYGADHIVVLPDTRLLPQVQAVIIGLTEGVIDLQSVEEFLLANKVSKENAKQIARSVSRIPIGAQALLPNFDKIPMAGDLFAEKTDLWPMSKSDAAAIVVAPTEAKVESWL